MVQKSRYVVNCVFIVRHRIILIFLTTLSFFPNFGFAQTSSNEGSEFWVAFPTHVPDFDKQFNISLANISIFLTGGQASSGVISAGTFSKKFKITPQQVTQIDIPRDSAYINDFEGGSVLHNRAIHISVDSGMPKIVAYAHIYAGQRSAASLILPKEALGQQYYSVNYQQFDKEGQNYITVIASEPNTTIHIKKGNTELVPGGIKLIAVNDVYEYLSDNDLTGVSVSVDSVTSGCKHFALFSGSTGLYIPGQNCTPTSIDPLYQQCYPIESWGTEFGFIPFSTESPAFQQPVRTAGQFLRVVAKNVATVIKINGNTVATLNPGEFFTTPDPLISTAFISANNPVCVAQYALTQSCSDSPIPTPPDKPGYSDPDMVILNPIQYNIKDITLYSSTKENIVEQYVNILIKTNAATSFRVNGQVPVKSFVPFISLPGYSYLQLALKDSTNTFHITAADGFNAIAYGFGNVESYSYSAGTNLASTATLDAVETASNNIIDSACVNDDYFFKLTLPYIAQQISWKLDASENAIVQASPVASQATVNGRTTYSYILQKTGAYKTPGIHDIKILAVYSKTIGGCGNATQEIDASFKVIAPPIVSFITIPAICGDSVYFKNISTDPGHQIVSYQWDFGDKNSPVKSNTSTVKSPAHAYTDSGTYYVKLIAISSTGCQSFKIDTLHITNQLLLNFSTTQPACSGKPVIFSDISKTSGFNTLKRKWYFGDGDSTTTTGTPFITHIYIKPGKYAAKLLLISSQGCTSDTLTTPVTVNPEYAPDFSFPGICLTDQVAHFINKTTVPDSSILNFTYLWHFGDDYASGENPDISTAQDPFHTYSQAKTYNVSLTVSSPIGCDTTITKKFTVNGIVPKANFSVQASNICSGEPVLFTDKSAVLDFGAITKLEWYFDVVNHPFEKLTVDTLNPNHSYIHFYPKFNRMPDSAKYTVKLIAYSGSACADSMIQTFSVLPAPQLKFDSLSMVCLQTKPFQLKVAQETSGISGAGAYSGPGVIANNTFDPLAAGLGTHQIKYKFTTLNGCIDSISGPITVISEPAVQTKNEMYVFQGDSIRLDPVYTGSGLKYRWSPALGLNHPDIASPKARPLNNITYTVTVTNGDCQATGAINVIVLKPPVVYNTFTPNGDGVNDLWNIPNLNDYPGSTVDIFNRYGATVYHSEGYPKPWDGKYRGQNVPSGTYYYVISPKNHKGIISGFVLLLR